MIIDATPFLRIRIENPLLNAKYPQEGEVLAIVDTGYEGFLAVPPDVYSALKLDQLIQQHGEIILPDGRVIQTNMAYGTIHVAQAKIKLDGPIETFPQLDEIILGQQALTNLNINLNYCQKHITIKPCQQT